MMQIIPSATVKNVILLLLLVSVNGQLFAQSWQPAGDQMKTKWAAEVTPENAWQQYPRPQLQRKEWINLNGLWDYSITGRESKKVNEFQGKILVPFCVESSLSGVGKPLKPDRALWYRTYFTIPETWKERSVVLHFGAVDWEMELFINGHKAGSHKGGSDPFSFDISRYLKRGEQEIKVRVWDPTDTDIQPRGKQTLNPRGFWYTAVSGIWQTVWLEPVSSSHIDSFFSVADIDNSRVNFHTIVPGLKGNEKLKIRISLDNQVVLEKEVSYNKAITLNLPDQKLWSPAFPNLYNVELELTRENVLLDKITTYFAQRKISIAKDKNGFNKLFLNNKELFQYGTLDQGWWPDGLLTPPTDEAMKYDMEVLKSMGFNMIRKHIKVEPDRYYYHADKLGMLLWQDMPSGLIDISDTVQHVAHDAPADWDRPEKSAIQFRKEWKAIMDSKRFFPSIVVWVPFNEGWGQFNTREIVKWTMDYDTTRLVDGTSGWTDREVGNFYDAHQYPGPAMEPSGQNPDRVVVLGEFGGLGHPVTGHLWDPSRDNWGYRTYTDKDTLISEYSQLIFNLYPELSRGLAAAIYTQTTDVEAEVNGLMTYDRKIIKLPVALVRVLSSRLYEERSQKATFLVKDSEIGSSKIQISLSPPADAWTTSGNEESFQEMKGPVQVKTGQSVWSVAKFNADKKVPGMALKLYAHGNVTIFLNGVKVQEKFYRTKRHYDDVNLSDCRQYIKQGENILAIQLTDVPENTNLDYGLYAY